MWTKDTFLQLFNSIHKIDQLSKLDNCEVCYKTADRERGSCVTVGFENIESYLFPEHSAIFFCVVAAHTL